MDKTVRETLAETYKTFVVAGVTMDGSFTDMLSTNDISDSDRTKIENILKKYSKDK